MRRDPMARWPRRMAWFGVGLALALAGCVSVGIGNEPATRLQYVLHDPGATPAPACTPPAAPRVPALLIQALPADALADTVSIAWSRRPNEIGFYQVATWTERPVRVLPRLLQRRLEACGVAGAVGMIGEPLRADWLLAIAVETLHHDLAPTPGMARVALTAELFDRRGRVRVARRRFEAAVPVARADSSAAAASISAAVAQLNDALVPWVDAELARAVAAAAP